jgi:hypothetical protein
MFRLVDYLCRYERLCQAKAKQSIRTITRTVKQSQESEPGSKEETKDTKSKTSTGKVKQPIHQCFEFYPGIKYEKGFYVNKITEMKE